MNEDRKLLCAFYAVLICNTLIIALAIYALSQPRVSFPLLPKTNSAEGR